MNKVVIIVATTPQGVIGMKGAMPWGMNQKTDLKRFKDLTIGHVVIMGRKTWESLPRACAPLPHRINKIISTTITTTTDADVHSNLDEAIIDAQNKYPEKKIFIIGGGLLYSASLSQANIIYQTIIHTDIEGDTFFNKGNGWHQTALEKHSADVNNMYPYTFVQWEK
ncbi:MAG: dihydrofolate reductase [Alphaproteobacteria bacterium]|nr:dihydrofolate reductase [Alphaproteobacteria bacterium]